jgi:hypothetical protein
MVRIPYVNKFSQMQDLSCKYPVLVLVILDFVY